VSTIESLTQEIYAAAVAEPGATLKAAPDDGAAAA
jgi:hypothetical protein